MPEGFGGLVDRIQKEIPGAARAWHRQDPHPYDPPHSLLIVHKDTEDTDHYTVAVRLSHQLDHFLLVARLLTAGTVQKTYEVTRTSTLVSRMDPLMRTFGKASFDQLVRRAPGDPGREQVARREVPRRAGTGSFRTVHLSGDRPAFEALSRLITSAEVPHEGMVTTSFRIAFDNFNGACSRIWSIWQQR